MCKSDGHSNATCWSQNNKVSVNKGLASKGNKLTSKNREKKRVSKKVSSQGAESSKEEDYENSDSPSNSSKSSKANTNWISC